MVGGRGGLGWLRLFVVPESHGNNIGVRTRGQPGGTQGGLALPVEGNAGPSLRVSQAVFASFAANLLKKQRNEKYWSGLPLPPGNQSH